MNECGILDLNSCELFLGEYEYQVMNVGIEVIDALLGVICAEDCEAKQPTVH